MATRRIQDLENIEEVLPDSIIPVGESTKTKSMLVSQLKNWLSSFFVGKTGDEIINGNKEYTGQQIYNAMAKYNCGNVDIGTTPANTQFFFNDYLDKNGERIGVIGVQNSKSGRSGVYLQTGNIGNLIIGRDENGKFFSYCNPSDYNNSIVTTVAKSKAKNGHFKLGNGLIVQWGQDVFEGSSTTITLPTPFTSTNYSIAHCPIDTAGTYCVGMLVESKTTSNFVGHGWNTAGRVRTTDFWIAMGY